MKMKTEMIRLIGSIHIQRKIILYYLKNTKIKVRKKKRKPEFPFISQIV